MSKKLFKKQEKSLKKIWWKWHSKCKKLLKKTKEFIKNYTWFLINFSQFEHIFCQIFIQFAIVFHNFFRNFCKISFFQKIIFDKFFYTLGQYRLKDIPIIAALRPFSENSDIRAFNLSHTYAQSPDKNHFNGSTLTKVA